MMSWSHIATQFSPCQLHPHFSVTTLKTNKLTSLKSLIWIKLANIEKLGLCIRIHCPPTSLGSYRKSLGSPIPLTLTPFHLPLPSPIKPRSNNSSSSLKPTTSTSLFGVLFTSVAVATAVGEDLDSRLLKHHMTAIDFSSSRLFQWNPPIQMLTCECTWLDEAEQRFVAIWLSWFL